MSELTDKPNITTVSDTEDLLTEIQIIKKSSGKNEYIIDQIRELRMSTDSICTRSKKTSDFYYPSSNTKSRIGK